MARQLALKTIKAMIRNDWTKCNDDIKQISGVCSSYLRGKDPNMTLAAFQSLWCHNNTLASVTSPSGDVEDRLELQLSAETGSIRAATMQPRDVKCKCRNRMQYKWHV